MTRKQVVILAMGILAAGVAGAWPFRRAAPLAESAPAIPSPSEKLAPTEPVLNPPEINAPAPVMTTAAPAADVAFEAAGPEVPTAAEAASQAEPAAPRAEARLRNLRPAWRKHRIQDGDSLSKLAQKYLGDAAREAEIFALNRDVLASPDILPVGRWLRIPSEGGSGKVY
jgi:nucleoid-associated protein YgaU